MTYTISEAWDTHMEETLDRNPFVTGIEKLDALLKESDSGLIGIGSRPAMGKMAVVLSTIVNGLQRDPDYVAVIYVLDGDVKNIVIRLASIISGVPASVIRKGEVEEEDLSKIAYAKGFLRDKKLYIIDDVPFVKQDFFSSLIEIKLENKRLDLAVIDSLKATLSDMSENDFDYDDYDEDDDEPPIRREWYCETPQSEFYYELCNDLSAFAKSAHCHIIIPVYLSRSTEERSDHRPRLTDIRSKYGPIANAMDIVLLLYRDEYYNVDTRKEGIMEIIVARNVLGYKGCALAEYDNKTIEVRTAPFEDDWTYWYDPADDVNFSL